jgi:hypothetical protein
MGYLGQQTSQRIVEEIHRKTGLHCVQLEDLDTSHEGIARVTLPILAEWVSVVPEDNIRAAIYSRFNSKYASQFLPAMVTWATEERSERGREILNFAIATALRPEDADYVWQVLPELSKTPAYYAILVRLAGIPAVAAKAKLAIANGLQDSKLGISELIYVSEVYDPRITAWFERKMASADKRERAVAHKVIDRGKRLPRGIAVAESAPNRSIELFSTEVDLDQASHTLARLEKELSLRLPPVVRRAQFLSRLSVDKWVMAMSQWTGNRSAMIYFRLEDFSTVEIVVVPVNAPDGMDRAIPQ